MKKENILADLGAESHVDLGSSSDEERDFTKKAQAS